MKKYHKNEVKQEREKSVQGGSWVVDGVRTKSQNRTVEEVKNCHVFSLISRERERERERAGVAELRLENGS